jgi:hypothetical protein
VGSTADLNAVEKRNILVPARNRIQFIQSVAWTLYRVLVNETMAQRQREKDKIKKKS